ncbi:MAG: DUF3999 family protein [Bacillota bacterium]
MKKRLSVFLILFFVLSTSSTVFSDDPIEGWKYYKDIQGKQDDPYKAFFLDEDIYRNANDNLSDIRLVNEKNEFVPYFLSSNYLHTKNDMDIEFHGNKLNTYRKNNDTYTDFEILSSAENEDVFGSKLVLSPDEKEFLKAVKVYGSYDNQLWDFLKDDQIYQVNDLKKTEIHLDTIHKYKYYRFQLIDNVEGISLQDLKLVYNEKEITYQQYKKTRAIKDYAVENTDNKTTILIENADHLKISGIQLLANTDIYNRTCQIYYSEKDQKDFTYLLSDRIYKIHLKNYQAQKNEISIYDGIGYFLRLDTIKIVIENQDDKPLDISEIQIDYYVDKVVYKKDESPSYKVYYGNSKAQKPSYDIEDYKQYIEGEQQELCTLSAEVKLQTAASNPDKPFNYKLLLNSIVALISVSLIFIIFKSSRNVKG